MMSLLALLLALEPASVWKYRAIEPTEEALLFTEVSGEPVACTVELDLSITGELQLVSPLSCPDALFDSVRSAVVEWRFNPAQEGERSVAHRQAFTAVFESSTVWQEPVEDARYAHVRVPPIAVPQWPQSPREEESIQRLFRETALPGASCVLEFEVSERGSPRNLVIESCPSEVARAFEKSLRRWGLKVVGAALGDQTRYRLEVPF